MATRKPHRHRWRLSSYGTAELDFRCRCGERRSRSTTAREARILKKKFSYMFNRTPHYNVHATSHALDKYLPKGWRTWMTQKQHIDLMNRIERFAKKHPRQVLIGRCDDDVFMGSRIYFIVGAARRRFFGTRVIYVPQNGEQPPAEFFLYPGHADTVVAALRTIRNIEHAVKRYNRKHKRKPNPAHKGLFKLTPLRR